MPGPKPLSMTLSEKQRGLLDHLIRRQTNPHRLVHRVQTILAAADGLSNDAIARRLHLCRDTVRDWRQRWQDGAEALKAADGGWRCRPGPIGPDGSPAGRYPPVGFAGGLQRGTARPDHLGGLRIARDLRSPGDPLDASGAGR
jgi:hypothetical protein